MKIKSPDKKKERDKRRQKDFETWIWMMMTKSLEKALNEALNSVIKGAGGK